MAEGTYEYECMRAELLGVDPPNYEEFMRKKKEQEAQQVESEEIETENLKEAEAQGEGLQNVSGGLDELNNILSITQKKIDRFKVRCNSITSLLKMKVGSLAGEGPSTSGEPTEGENSTETHNPEDSENSEEPKNPQNGATNEAPRKSQLAKALDNHVDKLDSMLEKAENAQYSMAHQNKQMKKLLQ